MPTTLLDDPQAREAHRAAIADKAAEQARARTLTLARSIRCTEPDTAVHATCIGNEDPSKCLCPCHDSAAARVEASARATAIRQRWADDARLTAEYQRNKTDPAAWMKRHQISPDPTGRVIVYKAVNDKLVSGYGTPYPIGETVRADDWRRNNACGNGLHFSPTPPKARKYGGSSSRLLACEISATDFCVIDEDKIKAESCRVLFEVDYHGIPRRPRR